MDVTRKVITLARECGANVELRDINTENLIPEPLRQGVTLAEFMDQLPEVSHVLIHGFRQGAPHAGGVPGPAAAGEPRATSH